jgi:hypothetical protein
MQNPTLKILAFSFLAGLGLPAHAQHEGHDMSMGAMDSDIPDGILVQPLGSGTSWLPADANPHAHAVHIMAGEWMIMTHGEAFARYTAANLNNPDRWPPPAGGTAGGLYYPRDERGGARFDAPNWAMASAERDVFGDDRLLLRAMLSLDPLTVGRRGYPLLFQTGEGLADRQHAHDLFMELGALYVHPLRGATDGARVFAYAGLPGEPALGPTAFMHRPSAGGNADAPLGHHFQDATHITQGVVTLGWANAAWKAEGSTFRGREPDADRWDIDAGPLDSYSFRLTRNAGAWSLQGSGAWIHAPEPGEHGGITRVTASASRQGRALGGDMANTFVYGMNAGHHGGPMHSFLKEGSITWDRYAAWGRWESLQRGGEELDLPAPDAGERFWAHALTLGGSGRVARLAGLDFDLGAQAGVNFYGEALRAYYGDVPLSAQAWLRARPAN